MALMALSSRLLARGRPGMTLALSRRAPLSSSGAPLAAKAESMKQVDVDSAAVQENLGKMQMEFIKKVGNFFKTSIFGSRTVYNFTVELFFGNLEDSLLNIMELSTILSCKKIGVV